MKRWTSIQEKPYVPGLLIVVFIAIIYIPALNIYLIGDDFECLNAVYSGWKNPIVIIKLIGLFFRPLLQFTFLLKYTLVKTHAPFYIATVVFVHLLNVFLLYTLLLKITGKIHLSVITALLYGTSSMYSEAMLVTGYHSDSLLSLFFLGTCIFLSNKDCSFGIKDHIWLLVLVLGAASSKGTWIVLPFLVVSFLLLVMNNSFKKALVLSIPVFLVMFIYALIFLIIPHFRKTSSAADYFEPRIGTMVTKAAYLMYRYLGLGDHFYGHAWQFGLIVIIFVSFTGMLILLKNRLALWGMTWMFLAIMITLPVYYAPSRYNYLPLIGFWIMVAAFFDQILRMLIHKLNIRREIIFLCVGACLCYLVPYQIIMVQWEIKDYRRFGDAHKTVVEWYNTAKEQIFVNQRIIFINYGTRKPIHEITSSLQGYQKLLFARSQAIWQLIYFAPLANFAGEPFKQRMIPIQQEQIANIFQQDFHVLIFTDQGFFFGEQEVRDALHHYYNSHNRLPDDAEAYQLISLKENSS